MRLAFVGSNTSLTVLTTNSKTLEFLSFHNDQKIVTEIVFHHILLFPLNGSLCQLEITSQTDIWRSNIISDHSSDTNKQPQMDDPHIPLVFNVTCIEMQNLKSCPKMDRKIAVLMMTAWPKLEIQNLQPKDGKTVVTSECSDHGPVNRTLFA